MAQRPIFAVAVLVCLRLALGAWSQETQTQRKPGDTRSPEEISELKRKAEAGNTKAQFTLGLAYLFGEGVSRDYAEAAKWLTKASEQGNVDAKVNLANLYQYGLGVPKDEAKAVELTRVAAEAGDASAQFNLGVKYANGRGVPLDNKEAAKWFRKSAEQGNAMGEWARPVPRITALCASNFPIISSNASTAKEGATSLPRSNPVSSCLKRSTSSRTFRTERRLAKPINLLSSASGFPFAAGKNAFKLFASGCYPLNR